MSIAAAYPNDIGITAHPDVILATRWESATWIEDDIEPGYSGWTSDRCYYVNNPSLAYEGSGVGQHDHEINEHFTHVFNFWPPGLDHDTVYVRWHRKHSSGFSFACQIKSIGVYARNEAYSQDGMPTGLNKYSVKLQTWDAGSNQGEPKFYTWHMDQPNPNWGETLAQNQGSPTLIMPPAWNAYEIMLKANTPGVANGELKLWIDGTLKGSYTGMRFRTVSTLKVNQLNVTAYIGGACTASQNQTTWDDNLVVAADYIGPMVEASSTPTQFRIEGDSTGIIPGYNDRIKFDATYKNAVGTIVHRNDFVVDLLSGENSNTAAEREIRAYAIRTDFETVIPDRRGSITTTQTDPNGHLGNLVVDQDEDL